MAAPTTIFVRNLPYDLSVQELGDSFLKFGKVINARIITYRSFIKKVRLSRGYGFVDFEAGTNLDAVMVPNAVQIKGRTIFVSVARPKRVIVDNIFVARIGPHVTPDTLKAHFANYHPVAVKIVSTYESETKKGFGFVQVASQQDRDQAVKDLNNSILDEKQLIVHNARRAFFDGPDPRRRRAPRAQNTQNATATPN